MKNRISDRITLYYLAQILENNQVISSRETSLARIQPVRPSRSYGTIQTLLQRLNQNTTKDESR